MPLAEALQQPYTLWQVKVPAQDSAAIDALSQHGFRLVEGEVDLAINIKRTERQTGVRIAREAQIPQHCVPRRLRRSPSAAFAHLGINLMTAAGFMLCGLKRPF